MNVQVPAIMHSCCELLHNTFHTYFCERCSTLRCTQCVQEDIESYFCPHCMENVSRAEAARYSNRCKRCILCPNAGCGSVLTYSQRMRERDIILRCSVCLWSSLSLNSAQSAPTAAALASAVLQREHDEKTLAQSLFDAQLSDLRSASTAHQELLRWQERSAKFTGSSSLKHLPVPSLHLKPLDDPTRCVTPSIRNIEEAREMQALALSFEGKCIDANESVLPSTEAGKEIPACALKRLLLRTKRCKRCPACERLLIKPGKVAASDSTFHRKHLSCRFFPQLRLGRETTFTHLAHSSVIRLTVQNQDKFAGATLQISPSPVSSVCSYLSAFEVPAQVLQLTTARPETSSTSAQSSKPTTTTATLTLSAADGSPASCGEIFAEVHPLHETDLSQVASTLFAFHCHLEGGPADAPLVCEYLVMIRLACVAQISIPE
eukprot:CAMPEP_0177679238 /NCGR_PEP_ID=MMETSP0447-20121125/29489_1 /TAXON_ID=0 /ORGANISM="Stygamoeba regulata, Strain BSH-02190019" /LENGTH=433 /DNA_ID=CAMNT_0019188401 /DNA_START=81 /DNA_END=1382 /DNA_ORIENTATION=-